MVLVYGQPTEVDTGLAGAPWYQPVSFRSLERVDLYASNWAYVYASGNICVLKVLLASQEEAMRFADLMLSIHASSARGGR